MCAICGTQCDEWLTEARAVTDEPVMTEPMYRVRAQVNENGHPLYAVGALITLQEAVLRDLPGAKEQAVNPQVTKPTQSAENRDAPQGSDR